MEESCEKTISFQDLNKNYGRDENQRKNKSSLMMNFFNLSNSIVGTGIIVLCDAIQKAGFLVGIIMTIAASLIASYTGYLLAVCAKTVDGSSYSDLAKKSHGKIIHIFTLVCNILLPLSMCIAYVIVIGDNSTMVMKYFFPTIWWVQSRVFCLGITIFLIAFPISIAKHIAFIHNVSFISIILVAFYTLVFAIKTPEYSSKILILPDTWHLIKSGLAQGLSTLILAFIAHHSMVLLFNSLERNTIKRFSIVIHLSMGLAFLFYCSVIISGYSSFAGMITGNILNNYCVDDKLITAARIIYTLTVLATLPLQVIATRSASFELGKKYVSDTKLWRLILTFLIHLISFLIGCLSINISVVIELAGSLTAAPIIFILPSMFYLNLVVKSYKKITPTTIPLYLLILTGAVVMIYGTYLTISNALNDITPEAITRYWCDNEIF